MRGAILVPVRTRGLKTSQIQLNMSTITYRPSSFQRADYWQLFVHPGQPTRYALSSGATP